MCRMKVMLCYSALRFKFSYTRRTTIKKSKKNLTKYIQFTKLLNKFSWIMQFFYIRKEIGDQPNSNKTKVATVSDDHVANSFRSILSLGTKSTCDQLSSSYYKLEQICHILRGTGFAHFRLSGLSAKWKQGYLSRTWSFLRDTLYIELQVLKAFQVTSGE